MFDEPPTGAVSGAALRRRDLRGSGPDSETGVVSGIAADVDARQRIVTHLAGRRQTAQQLPGRFEAQIERDRRRGANFEHQDQKSQLRIVGGVRSVFALVVAATDVGRIAAVAGTRARRCRFVGSGGRRSL